ncbi:hypothetical protein DB88DRAFT_500058 [Papiliotrema laurentii]|uniref:Core domain-containing protein n=1 Tax=Papiliotrema laurentii TaxID=5418 RepID=A0AAD9FPY9_PAPLA|nr:hypothetical protein DB88DRAFT_500058 [Papiliotrema laurentii]
MTCRACLSRLASARISSGHAHKTNIAIRSLTTSTTTTTTPTPLLNNLAGPSRIRLPSSRVAAGGLSGRSAEYIVSRSSSIASIAASSRRAASTLRKPAQDTVATPRHPLKVTPPSLDAIQEEGYLEDDVQLIPEEEAWINITPEAIAQLVKITSKEPPEVLAQNKLALRVGVESGGCHGYQYTMEIVEDRGTDDYVMQPEGVDCIPVVIDLVSLGLLKGATLHHATELIGSSFRLQDNPQAKEGGNCGCGVSWELK